MSSAPPSTTIVVHANVVSRKLGERGFRERIRSKQIVVWQIGGGQVRVSTTCPQETHAAVSQDFFATAPVDVGFGRWSFNVTGVRSSKMGVCDVTARLRSTGLAWQLDAGLVKVDPVDDGNWKVTLTQEPALRIKLNEQLQRCFNVVSDTGVGTRRTVILAGGGK